MTARPDRTQPPRMVELFAGVGGFRLGLEPHGFRTVWANQWEPSTRTQHAFDCYVRHFGDTPAHVCEDIEHVLDEVEAGRLELPDDDLLVGGHPCQDYSVARTLSQARGIQGRKGVLWWQIHRLLEMKRPPALFLENVDRLLKSPAPQRGRDFAIMLATLNDLGYDVEWRVVNAADYGFPQKRRRVYIVGRRAGAEPRDPGAVIQRGVLGRALPVVEASTGVLAGFGIDGDPADISESFGARSGPSPFKSAGYASHRRVWTAGVTPAYDDRRQTLGDILQDDREVPDAYRIPEGQLATWRYLKGAKREPREHRGSGTPYLYSEGAIPFPDHIDGPSRTILTAEGGATPSRFKHVVATADGGYRRLTPRELERLNGFPDDWTVTGMPEGRRAFAMGNALVVGIVERIGAELAREFRDEPAGG